MQNVTKSAVSQALSKLESELGAALFLRRRSGMIPTDFADQVIALMTPLMEALSQNKAKRQQLGLTGFVRIVAPPLFSATHIAGAIREFVAIHPHVRFQLSAATIDAVQRKLMDGLVDLAIVDSAEVFWKGRFRFLEARLHAEPEVLVCSRKYYETVL